MKADFTKGLINAFNLNNYYSDNINTNLTVKNGQIVCSFEGNPEVNKYIQEMKNEIIARHCGEEIAGKLFDLKSFPFSADGVKHIYNKDGTVEGLRVDITPKVEYNFKLHFAMAFQRFVRNKMKEKFEENPKTTKNQMEAISAFIQSIKLGRMGGTINDLYSICLDGVESSDPKMNKALKEFYVTMFEEQLENCGLNSSEFFEYDNNILSIKDITNVRVVNNIAKYTEEHVVPHFANQGDKNSKVKNIKDVLRRKIFQLTKANEKEGIVIDGYDCDTFVDKNRVMDGHNFVLLPLVKANGRLEFLSNIDAYRINEAFRKGGFGDILIDIKDQTENIQFSDSEEPVYAISNKQLALLIPELMQSPIAYNEASKCFEYAINLGNLYLEKQHNTQSDIIFKQVVNTDFLNVPQSTGGRGSTTSICTSSTDSRSASPMPRNSSSFRDRSDSKGSKDSGTYSRIGSADSVSDSLNRKIVPTMAPVEETSGEYSPPVAPAENKPGPSFKRGSENRSSAERIVHFIASTVKEVSGEYNKPPISEVNGVNIEQQSKKKVKRCVLL